MTDRERFCAIQTKRGYEVINSGLMSIMTYKDNEITDRQVWFWNPDGTKDKTGKSYQKITFNK